MAWTAPRTWNSGEILTATNLNAHIRDNEKELFHVVGYTEFTSSVTLAGTTEGSPTDIVSAGAITFGGFPVIVEFYTPLYSNASQATNGINLWDGATDLGRIVGQAVSVSLVSPVHVIRTLTPSAASHTFKVRGWGGSGTGVVTAGAGGVGTTMPGFIKIWERGG